MITKKSFHYMHNAFPNVLFVFVCNTHYHICGRLVRSLLKAVLNLNGPKWLRGVK